MRWLYLFAGCWLLAVAGCASTDAVKNATPVATHLPVSVDFVLVETSSSLTNLVTEQQLLKSKLITGYATPLKDFKSVMVRPSGFEPPTFCSGGKTYQSLTDHGL